jgi:type I restriction enzyme S subunit
MPVEHPQARLDSLCLAIKDGTHGTHRRTDSGIPLLSAKNITRDGRLEWDREDSLISESEYRAIHATFRLQREDLLLTIVGSLGRRALFDGSKVTFQRSVAYLRPDQAKTLPTFLYHALSDASYQRQLIQRSNATAQAGLYLGELSATTVPAPPLPEQLRIAQILDTLDEAIRKTEQVIAKLQKMKQGLLRDLLTRGIDENGELRDPERHPEQFKDSLLGRIPRGWDVEAVEGLLDDVEPAMRSGPFGSALLKEELVGSGIPMLGIDNVYVERFERQFTRFVSPQKAVELSRYRVRPKDVMITIMGTVGRCALVPDDIGEALSSKHVWTLTFNSARYLPYLACLQFNHAPWVLTHFGRDVQGGIMSAIRSETLRTALLPVPPIAEQIEIMSIFTDLDQRLASESLEAGKLRTLKQGLMEDLLTGRVRACVEPEAAAD